MPDLSETARSAQEPCQQCVNEPSLYQCMVCKAFYGEACASPTDPTNFCKNCLASNSIDLKIDDKLVDEEGAEHAGRLITPTGDGYKTAVAVISEMTQYQLEAHIEHYRGLVKQAELTLDQRRVVLATAELEGEGRKEIERRKRRNDPNRYKSASAIAKAAAKGANGKADPMALMAAAFKALGPNHPTVLIFKKMLEDRAAQGKKP